MDLLLDTHLFLWWDVSSTRLGAHARALIADSANRVFLSAASVQEIAIKRRSGKLAFEGRIVDAIRRNSFIELPVAGLDAEAGGDLAWNHADPFDRLVLAQAQRHVHTLITADALMREFEGVAHIAAS